MLETTSRRGARSIVCKRWLTIGPCGRNPPQPLPGASSPKCTLGSSTRRFIPSHLPAVSRAFRADRRDHTRRTAPLPPRIPTTSATQEDAELQVASECGSTGANPTEANRSGYTLRSKEKSCGEGIGEPPIKLDVPHPFAPEVPDDENNYVRHARIRDLSTNISSRIHLYDVLVRMSPFARAANAFAPATSGSPRPSAVQHSVT